MNKSSYSQALDAIQLALKPFFKLHGFKVRGRTYNRSTSDGLTQVINFQMGSFDPPGTNYIPGLRENMHGLFAVNLGVYVPEVGLHHSGSAKAWVQEPYCCVRKRLGALIGDGKEIWWHADNRHKVIDDIRDNLDKVGLPFLDRYASRDRILALWNGITRSNDSHSPARIVLAIILAARGQKEQARQLLRLQHDESIKTHPGHADYVRGLVKKLGLPSLDN